MKKTIIILLSAMACAAAICAAVFVYFRLTGSKDDPQAEELNALDEASDYLDDLDSPALPEKEEKAYTKPRRGYISIPLGRE